MPQARAKWGGGDRTKRTAARGLEMHLKSLCGGSALLRDEFLQQELLMRQQLSRRLLRQQTMLRPLEVPRLKMI